MYLQTMSVLLAAAMLAAPARMAAAEPAKLAYERALGQERVVRERGESATL